ncbi:hypothetical protein F3Y22_tig00112231pilonHSYRG00153 [Hibiscus syriacus]|uniref:Uncharacterized protein n=1 Tax=Hibiscus syriacus TaxID=106335 RepID=A0A6A2X437_HIBSY|nr:hypothetical protein F3Y22_tig00112231pilonHSYRG00153 [Hibiscus syriacus]
MTTVTSPDTPQGSKFRKKPLIINALGNVGNIVIAPSLERPDRISTFVPIGSLVTMDRSRLMDVKTRISDDSDKVKVWRIPDINDPSHLKVLRLSDTITAGK